jgi:hypothetical protein
MEEATRRDSLDVSPKQGESNKSMHQTPDNFKNAYKKFVANSKIDQKFSDCVSESQNNPEGAGTFMVRIPKFVQ